MVDVRKQTKLTSWPSPQDYNEAIQNLAANTEHAELKNGTVQTSALGLPRSITGAFASVYRVTCGKSETAVRCFLRDISDQEARYKLISEFVENDSLPYTVSFDFMSKGIRVGTGWYPALKMDWVEGTNLDLFVEQHLGSPDIANLADSFKRMCGGLREAGIAHGDLQHGNIIVCGDGLKLVDYDGMYVPAMEGMQANELGHRNYQHPLRTPDEFGPHLDNFSAWVIYASLRAVALDKALWELLGAGDDCLLFRRDDFVEPEHSYAFAVLEHHPNEEIRALAKFLRWQCHNPMRDVPPLADEIPSPPSLITELTTIAKPRRAPQTHARKPPAPIANQSLPEWIHRDAKAHAVLAARPQPKAPPSRVGLSVESELQQPLPRLVGPARGLVAPWTAARERKLIEDGEAVRTESFAINPLSTNFYEVEYTFRGPRNKRLIHVKRPMTRREYTVLKGAQEATILCDRMEPEPNHGFYELMHARAAKPIVPTGIERELQNPRRHIRFKDNNFIHPALLSCILFTPAAAAMFACFALNSAFGWASVAFFLLVFWALFRQAKTQRALVSRGVPARATVQNVVTLPNGHQRAEYTFVSVIGNITSSVQLSPGDTSIRKGDIATVLYDLRKPEKNVLYQLAMYYAE